MRATSGFHVWKSGSLEVSESKNYNRRGLMMMRAKEEQHCDQSASSCFVGPNWSTFDIHLLKLFCGTSWTPQSMREDVVLHPEEAPAWLGVSERETRESVSLHSSGFYWSQGGFDKIL
jgi:hypothetical protein